MFNLGMRNFKSYLRDRSGVLFSFFGVLVIIVLYVLFLGENIKSGFADVQGGSRLIDVWVMAGIIAVASITSSVGACGIIVEDRGKKTQRDFFAAPLKRFQIVGGYVLNACLVGFVMCVLTFLAAEIYLVSKGGGIPDIVTIGKVLGIILLAVASSGAMALFIVSLLKTNNSYSNVSIVVGTLVGFLTGMYLPVGSLDGNVQWLVKLFPVSHAAVLLRQVMMEEAINASFTGSPAEVKTEFQEMMGVVFTFGDTTGTVGLHITVLIVTALLFFVLGIVNLSRKEK